MAQTTGPKLRLGTKSKEPLSGAAAILRLVAALFIITNVPAAILTVLVFLALRRLHRVRAWAVMLGGVAVCALMLLVAVQGPAYVQWVLDLAPAFDAIFTRGPIGATGVAAGIAGSHWLGWMLAQLPLAIGLGLTLGGALSMYARRHGAEWRRPKGHGKALDRKAAMKRTERMEQWAQPAPKAPRTRRARSDGDRPARVREQPVTTVDDVMIRFGIDQESARPADVPLAAFLRMCWIDGATGFGKTTDIIALVRGALEAPAAQPLRIPLVYVNLKPDPEVTEALRRIAHRAGRRFLHASLDGELSYNPIRHGTPGAVATRIIEVEDAAVDGGFSEPFHKANGQELLGYATRALDELVARGRTYERGGKRLPWKRDLPHLHRIMRLSTLMGTRHHLSGELQLDLAEYDEELKEIPRKRESAEGMRARIGKILTSAVGPLVEERPDGLNLETALREGDVVVFDLDSMQDTVAATSLANLVVKDLQAVLGHLGSQRWNYTGDKVTRMALVIIDEFSALGGDAVVDTIQRGRTNGGAVVLATQDVGSVIEAGQGLLTTILTNTNVQIVHVQSERAEEYASAWGTRKAMAETTQVFDDRTMLGTLTSKSGQGSLREVDQFVIHPNTLKKLGPGEVILATRHPWQQRRVLVQRRMPEPLTDEELREAEHDEDTSDSREDAAEQPATAASSTPETDEKPAAASPATEVEEEAPPAPARDSEDEAALWEAEDFELFDQADEEER